MKRLILVRHATAVEKGPKGSDFHRQLKKRGRREARIMAERLRTRVPMPDQWFSSPADRAIETATVFASHLGIPEERLVLREELYGGLLPEDFLHIVQRFDESHSSVMIFGHDPSFTEFAGFMIPGFREAIPKAGVLVMDFDRPRWKAVRAGDGRVVHYERPPAPDVQKRMEEDVLDRLVIAIRQGIVASTRSLEPGNSREVTRLIARMSTQLARELLPFVHTSENEKASTAAKKKGPARAQAKRKGAKPRVRSSR